MARRSWVAGPADLVFPFLAPAIQCSNHAPYVPAARFSTSPALWKRDNNPNRGVSILRHTGLRKRQTLSVNRYIKNLKDLPKPVEQQTKVEGTEDHGLWGFFRDKKLLRTPLQESQHGMRRDPLSIAASSES
jgi:large subunit ribosomal protein L47